MHDTPARPSPLFYLDENAVRDLLRLEDLIPAMKRALIEYSNGRVRQPERQFLEVKAHGGYLIIMPAVGESAGAKLVNFYPGNAKYGVPTHHAVILLFRPETGQPLAVMDGRLVTEMRTAAVSAVATQALAAPDSRVLAILGTGVQAHIHIEALGLIRKFDEIRVWGRSEEKAKRMAQATGAQAMSAEAAVRGADVIVTATSSKSPILKGSWLKSGAHVNAVGWNTNRGRELDDAAMQNLVVVESRKGTPKESGNIRVSGAKVHAEIGEILDGKKSVDPWATTVFDSVGMAVEDLAAASLVVNRHASA